MALSSFDEPPFTTRVSALFETFFFFALSAAYKLLLYASVSWSKLAMGARESKTRISPHHLLNSLCVVSMRLEQNRPPAGCIAERPCGRNSHSTRALR